MVHEIHEVVGFEKVRRSTLRVDFSDGVRLDSGARTLVWPDGADFDPAILHDWPERKADLERLAAGWGSPVAV
jgi:hypothetical protein